MDITQLSIAELADARERINKRQNALEDAAIATLGHRPFHFGWRLMKAAFGFRRTTHPPATEEVPA